MSSPEDWTGAHPDFISRLHEMGVLDEADRIYDALESGDQSVLGEILPIDEVEKRMLRTDDYT